MGYKSKQRILNGENSSDQELHKIYSSSLAFREMQTKTTLRSHLILVVRAKINKTSDSSCW